MLRCIINQEALAISVFLTMMMTTDLATKLNKLLLLSMQFRIRIQLIIKRPTRIKAHSVLAERNNSSKMTQGIQEEVLEDQLLTKTATSHGELKMPSTRSRKIQGTQESMEMLNNNSSSNQEKQINLEDH